MNVRVSAIVLAAGKSQRMGNCKPLLPLGDVTVIECCLGTLVAAGIDEIVVVVSFDGDLVAESVQRYPVNVVINRNPGGDMASSIRTGRDAISKYSSGILIALCDYPLVLSETVARLAAEHEKYPGNVVIPCFREQRGHPVLVPSDVLNELSGQQTLRDLLRCRPDRVCFVNVDDPGVLMDMDTPGDYRRICERSGYLQSCQIQKRLP